MVVKSNSDSDSIIYKFERVPSNAGAWTTWEELIGSYEEHTGTDINQEWDIVIILQFLHLRKQLEKPKELNWDFPKPHSIVYKNIIYNFSYLCHISRSSLLITTTTGNYIFLESLTRQSEIRLRKMYFYSVGNFGSYIREYI